MVVLYISSRSPYPKIGGREVMIAQSLEFLTSHFDTHLICFHGQHENIDKIKLSKLNLSSCHYIQLPKLLTCLKNIIIRYCFSLQENLYYSGLIQKDILKIIDEIRPDVIICDMIRTSQFVLNKTNGTPIIVDLDDLLSSRYRKMLKSENSFSLFGTYADRIPKIFHYLEKKFRNLILMFEYKRVSNAESEVAAYADAVILTSPKESVEFNKKFNTQKSIGISQALRYSKELCVVDDVKNDILFVGNLKTAQNIASLKFIVEEVLPELQKLIPKFTLRVVGSFDERAVNLASSSCHVELLGFVDDVKEIARQCVLSLMPVAFGTGIKTKVLDSMAMGLPTITNKVGAEGLNIISGEHVIINDCPIDMVASAYHLLHSEKLRKDIVRNAFKYLQENHEFSLIKDKYINLVVDVKSRK